MWRQGLGDPFCNKKTKNRDGDRDTFFIKGFSYSMKVRVMGVDFGRSIWVLNRDHFARYDRFFFFGLLVYCAK